MNKIGLYLRTALFALFVPVIASAQYKDLDTALSNLTHGFGEGDVQAIIVGIGDGDRVMLQFPGLVDESGFFGRDQATYLLERLFNKVRPTGFEQLSTKKNSAEKQYNIIGRWTLRSNEERELWVVLQQKGDRWAVVALKTVSK